MAAPRRRRRNQRPSPREREEEREEREEQDSYEARRRREDEDSGLAGPKTEPTETHEMKGLNIPRISWGWLLVIVLILLIFGPKVYDRLASKQYAKDPVAWAIPCDRPAGRPDTTVTVFVHPKNPGATDTGLTVRDQDRFTITYPQNGGTIYRGASALKDQRKVTPAGITRRVNHMEPGRLRRKMFSPYVQKMYLFSMIMVLGDDKGWSEETAAEAFAAGWTVGGLIASYEVQTDAPRRLWLWRVEPLNDPINGGRLNTTGDDEGGWTAVIELFRSRS